MDGKSMCDHSLTRVIILLAHAKWHRIVIQWEVVDSRLRVRDVGGLRVADISILPVLNSGHTQAPAYAIGEKVAHMILQDADNSK